MKKDHQQEWIDGVLDSLEGAQRAAANPFLYTRIKARMENERGVWGRVVSLVSRPVFAVGIIVLLLGVNAWAVYSGNHDGFAAAPTVQTNGNGAEIPEEYDLAVNTFYDYETP